MEWGANLDAPRRSVKRRSGQSGAAVTEVRVHAALAQGSEGPWLRFTSDLPPEADTVDEWGRRASFVHETNDAYPR